MNFRVIYHQPVCPDCDSADISTEDIDTTDGLSETAQSARTAAPHGRSPASPNTFGQKPAPVTVSPRRTWCCGSTPARLAPAQPDGVLVPAL